MVSSGQRGDYGFGLPVEIAIKVCGGRFSAQSAEPACGVASLARADLRRGAMEGVIVGAIVRGVEQRHGTELQ